MFFLRPAGVLPDSPLPSAHSGHGMVNGQRSLDLCSPFIDGRQPSPLTSPLLNDACSVRTDDEDEVRRKVGRAKEPDLNTARLLHVWLFILQGCTSEPSYYSE